MANNALAFKCRSLKAVEEGPQQAPNEVGERGWENWCWAAVPPATPGLEEKEEQEQEQEQEQQQQQQLLLLLLLLFRRPCRRV